MNGVVCKWVKKVRVPIRKIYLSMDVFLKVTFEKDHLLLDRFWFASIWNR